MEVQERLDDVADMQLDLAPIPTDHDDRHGRGNEKDIIDDQDDHVVLISTDTEELEGDHIEEAVTDVRTFVAADDSMKDSGDTDNNPEGEQNEQSSSDEDVPLLRRLTNAAPIIGQDIEERESPVSVESEDKANPRSQSSSDTDSESDSEESEEEEEDQQPHKNVQTLDNPPKRPQPGEKRKAESSSTSSERKRIRVYPAVKPTNKCGKCRHCLNPKWKQACLVRKQQEEERRKLSGDTASTNHTARGADTKRSKASETSYRPSASASTAVPLGQGRRDGKSSDVPTRRTTTTATTTSETKTTLTAKQKQQQQEELIETVRPLLTSSGGIKSTKIDTFLDMVKTRAKNRMLRASLLLMLKKSSPEIQKEILDKKILLHIQEWLKDAITQGKASSVKSIIETMDALPITEGYLKACEVGKLVGRLRRDKNMESIHELAKNVIEKWKALLLVSTKGGAATSASGAAHSGVVIDTKSAATTISTPAMHAAAPAAAPPLQSGSLFKPPAPKASTLIAAKKSLNESSDDIFSTADKKKASSSSMLPAPVNTSLLAPAHTALIPTAITSATTTTTSAPTITTTAPAASTGDNSKASIARVSQSPLDGFVSNYSAGNSTHSTLSSSAFAPPSSANTTTTTTNSNPATLSMASTSFLGATLSFQPLHIPLPKTAAQRAQEAADSVPDPEPTEEKERKIKKKKVAWKDDKTLLSVRWFWKDDAPIKAQHDAAAAAPPLYSGGNGGDSSGMILTGGASLLRAPGAAALDAAAMNPTDPMATSIGSTLAIGNNTNTNSTGAIDNAALAKKEHLSEAEALRHFREQEHMERSEIQHRLSSMEPTVGWYDAPAIADAADVDLGVARGEESEEAPAQQQRRRSEKEGDGHGGIAGPVQYASMEDIPASAQEPLHQRDYGFEMLSMAVPKIPLSIEEAAAVATSNSHLLVNTGNVGSDGTRGGRMMNQHHHSTPQSSKSTTTTTNAHRHQHHQGPGTNAPPTLHKNNGGPGSTMQHQDIHNALAKLVASGILPQLSHASPGGASDDVPAMSPRSSDRTAYPQYNNVQHHVQQHHSSYKPHPRNTHKGPGRQPPYVQQHVQQPRPPHVQRVMVGLHRPQQQTQQQHAPIQSGDMKNIPSPSSMQHGPGLYRGGNDGGRGSNRNRNRGSNNNRGTVCRFFKSAEGCRLGDMCPFQHI